MAKRKPKLGKLVAFSCGGGTAYWKLDVYYGGRWEHFRHAEDEAMAIRVKRKLQSQIYAIIREARRTKNGK